MAQGVVTVKLAERMRVLFGNEVPMTCLCVVRKFSVMCHDQFAFVMQLPVIIFTCVLHKICRILEDLTIPVPRRVHANEAHTLAIHICT